MRDWQARTLAANLINRPAVLNARQREGHDADRDHEYSDTSSARQRCVRSLGLVQELKRLGDTESECNERQPDLNPRDLGPLLGQEDVFEREVPCSVRWRRTTYGPDGYGRVMR